MYHCTVCHWDGETAVYRAVQTGPQSSLWVSLCPDCHSDVHPICLDCFYRSGYEEHLPIPFWFRVKFYLKFCLLRQRVKPQS